jgi:predicted secreted hydrolase
MKGIRTVTCFFVPPRYKGSAVKRVLLPGIIAAMLFSVAAHMSGPAASAQTAPSTSAPLVSLPADQAAHPKTHNEWWYVVGHMRSGARTFGYEVTIFKFLDVRPPGFSSAVSVYRTDIAITDETGKRFHQKVTYYFPQSASLSASTLNARVGNASLVASGANDLNLHAAFSKMSISLHLHSARPPMYVGGRGYINFGTQFTYYYSLTDLTSTGTITVNGQRFSVKGISWLDHQWGDWSWAGAKGWTWMALQLGNGTQLSLFDVRAFGTPILFASVLDKAGKTVTVPGVTIKSTGSWHSPHTGATYPSGWTVRIPALKAVFHVTPTVKDQELIAQNQPQGSYWEGSGRVTGTYGGKAVTGYSYTELTGYAGG